MMRLTRRLGLTAPRRPYAIGLFGLMMTVGLTGRSEARLAGRQVGSLVAGRRSSTSHFHFTPEAARQLWLLWSASVAAKQERVACLGGYFAEGVWQLTQIEPLVTDADSLGASAGESIERCGPPLWLGTVHTHIALRDGGRPYPTFSGADRGIMHVWSRRWNANGVFCLLYTDHDAHCEVEGGLVGGPETSATY